MREIKFRAWDNEMLVDVVPVRPEGDETPAIIIVNALTHSWKLRDVESIMQYTGLKDKNGKEIYEGDIVESTSDYLNWGTGKPTGKKCIETYQIIYVEDEAHFTTQSINSTKVAKHINKLGICQEQTGKYYEVIGNIYENKDLLKEEL